MSLIPVTDLKHWAHCPRVVYYHRVLPGAVSAFQVPEAGGVRGAAADGDGQGEKERTVRACGEEPLQ